MHIQFIVVNICTSIEDVSIYILIYNLMNNLFRFLINVPTGSGRGRGGMGRGGFSKGRKATVPPAWAQGKKEDENEN